MSEESTNDEQQTKKAALRAQFLQLPTPLEWVVIVGVVLVAYFVFFMRVMDDPSPEWRRLQERKQQQKVEQGERLPGVPPD